MKNNNATNKNDNNDSTNTDGLLADGHSGSGKTELAGLLQEVSTLEIYKLAGQKVFMLDPWANTSK